MYVYISFLYSIPLGHQRIKDLVCLSLSMVNVITVAVTETLCKLSISISLSLTERACSYTVTQGKVLYVAVLGKRNKALRQSLAIL